MPQNELAVQERQKQIRRAREKYLDSLRPNDAPENAKPLTDEAIQAAVKAGKLAEGLPVGANRFSGREFFEPFSQEFKEPAPAAERIAKGAMANAGSFLAGATNAPPGTPWQARALRGAISGTTNTVIDFLVDDALTGMGLPEPTSEDLNVEAGIGVAEAVFGLPVRKMSRIRERLAQATELKQAAAKIGIRTGAAGAVAGSDFLAGNQTFGQAALSTLGTGAFGGAIAESLGAGLRRMVGTGDPVLKNITNAKTIQDLQDYGVTVATGKGWLKNTRNFLGQFTMFGRKFDGDRRLMAAAVETARNMNLVPDQAVSNFGRARTAGGLFERNLPDVVGDARKAFVEKNTFQDIITNSEGFKELKEVHRRAKPGDRFIQQPDGSWRVSNDKFKFTASTNAPDSISRIPEKGSIAFDGKTLNAMRRFGKTDPGGLARFFGINDELIDDMVVPVFETLAPADRARVMNAYVTQAVFGKALEENFTRLGVTAKDLSDAARGTLETGLSRNKVDEALAIIPGQLKAGLSRHNQKLVAILGEGVDPKLGADRLERLNQVVELLDKHTVNPRTKFNQFSQTEVYMFNRLVFLGSATGAFATEDSEGGFGQGVNALAKTAGTILTLGTVFDFVINSPKMSKLLFNAIEGNSTALERLVTNAKAAGFTEVVLENGMKTLMPAGEEPEAPPEPPGGGFLMRPNMPGR